MALLTYDDVIAISYVGSDIAVLLTPEQQSLAVQAVALFTMPHVWSDWNENAALIDELVPATLLALETPVTNLFGGISVFCTPEWFVPDAGVTFQFTSEAADMHGGFWAVAAPAIGNGVRTPFFKLRAGTWELNVMYRKGSNAGILKFDIVPETGLPHTLPGTVDAYQNVGTPNQKHTASFTLADEDMWAIRIWSNTKNAASASYNVVLQSILLRRTGD